MTDIEKAATPPVPALANPRPASSEIDSSDIALPKVKVAQKSTKQVEHELVKFGQIFASTSEDDAEVLYDGKGDGLLFHVIGLQKGKSLSVDGDLMTWGFNDPDAPADAWTTYTYFLCLPEHDEYVPYKFLMTRSATPAAKNLNLLLKKGEAHGPSHQLAFRVTTAKKENPKGSYYVPVIRPAEATEAGIAAAANLAAMLADSPVAAEAPAPATNAPAI